MTNETTQTKPHPYAQVLRWVAEGKEIETFTGGEWITAVTSCILSAANRFGNTKYYQPEDFRLKPERHVHQDLIDAYNKGAKIQCWSTHDSTWKNCFNPVWTIAAKYRIKPEPKPDIVGYLCATVSGSRVYVSHCIAQKTFTDNIKVVFDGETNNIKSVEII